jgi:hypothetical protein
VDKWSTLNRRVRRHQRYSDLSWDTEEEPMPEIATRPLDEGELEIEVDGRFMLAVFESGGVWTGGRTGKTIIRLRPADS